MSQGTIDEILGVALNSFSCKIEPSFVTQDITVTELMSLDSLGFMQFICAIEKHFGIQFPDDITYEKLNDLSGLTEEIEKLKADVS